MSPRFVSWFAGVGCFDLAFLRAGWECAGACEINDFSRRVYAARFGHEPRWRDISRVQAKNIPKAEAWVAGFPCQDLSSAGKRSGFGGKRSALVFQLLDLYDALPPDTRPVLVLENVPGLFSVRGGRDFGVLLAVLDDLGLDVAWAVLDARWFGVAQRRRRVFLVGSPRGGPDPREVLFEPGCRTRHPTTRGEARSGAAHSLTPRVGGARLPRQRGGLVREEGPRRGGSCAKKDHAIESDHARALDTTGGFASAQGGTLVGALQASGGGGRGHRIGADEAAGGQIIPIAFDWRKGNDGKDGAQGRGWIARAGDYAGALRARGEDAVQYGMAVRRLTPLECELLQGLPPGWTCLCGVKPYQTAACKCKDGPRYTALGNGGAVPVMEWIARRLGAAMREWLREMAR